MILHPTKGVNPRMTHCRRCGGKSNELYMIGNHEFKGTCTTCKTVNYGVTGHRCMKKGCGGFISERTRIEDNETLPSTEPCDQCKQLLTVAEEAFVTGGILYRCDVCGSEGVIAGTSELAIAVRQQLGVQAPDPCGVSFDKTQQCPHCAGMKAKVELKREGS